MGRCTHVIRFLSRPLVGAVGFVCLSCTRDVEPTHDAVPVGHHVAAVVEITFTNIGSPSMTSSALVASSVAELEMLHAARAGRGASFDLTVPKSTTGSGNATIELDLLAAGAVTSNGSRYFQATYRVRNAQKTDSVAFNTARHNLTFVAVSTANTLLDTPVLVLKRQDGTPVDPLVARQLLPTGLVAVDLSGALTSLSPDVLQVLTEAEVAAIAVPPDVTNTFPYGFMVRRSGSTTTRTLDASPSASTFQGAVTFAFRVPVNSTAGDPSTISFMMLALDDSQTRLTESLEEQNPSGQLAAQQRATSLSASPLRLLAGGTAPGRPSSTTQLFCSVRTAGLAGAPTATLVNVGSGFQSLTPSPFTAAGSFVPRTSTIQALFSSAVQGVGPANFIVRGFQGGQAFRGATYVNSGSTATTPAGNFLSGDVLEVEITSGAACPRSWVGRLRVKVPTVSSGSLSIQAPFLAGDQPQSLAVGDFNGDGVLDLASANFNANTVTIFRGDGTGTFTAIGTVPVGSGPSSILTGDVNGDGFLDLITANFGTSNVSVALGRGDGTFGTAQSFAVGLRPTEVVLGDLNGDGILDLVALNSGADNLSILMGNGNGTFQSAPVVATDNNARAVAIGDLNADGILDLIVANGDHVSVFLGNGDGTFAVGHPFGIDGLPVFLAIGDVNGDGRADVVTVNSGSTDVSVLLGNGNGTLQTANSFNAGGRLSDVVIADMNGDGILDLVVSRADGNNSSVSILLGVGNGTFLPRKEFDTALLEPSFITVADVNRDGILDVIMGNDKTGVGSSTVRVFLGTP